MKIVRGLVFSPKTFLGVTKLKRSFARKTGIPTTRSGMYSKIGRTIVKGIFK